MPVLLFLPRLSQTDLETILSMFLESRIQGRGANRCAVKICGVTTEGDAQAIVAAGADAIGVNFWPGSKRYLEPSKGEGWLAALEGKIARVGVFVNASADEIEGLWERGILDLVQLHGDESADFCQRLEELGIPTMRALRVRDAGSLSGIRESGSPRVLLDAFQAGEYGGTGARFDWELARDAVTANPGIPIVLAGGLKPDNVAEAVSSVRPAAVDVAGGVESAPGRKDRELVAKFVSEARESDR